VRVDVDGIGLDVLDRDQAVDRVTSWLGGDFRHVVALNAAKAERARRDVDLRAAIRDADLVLADGVGVVLRARRIGTSVPRVAGVDLMESLLAVAAARSVPVFLLGGRGDVAARAAEVAMKRWPGLIVAGTRHGEGADEVALDVVIRSRAALLFAGLGTPRQERFLHGARDRLGAVCLGVGGALDVLCGDAARAPVPLRDAGLEWAWRLAADPRRLGQRRSLDALRYVLRTALPAH
jgi:N-acetylglucosaminyldiphosphoundecaprenol N-acetyl-beta-D-mannosaminyltransferase